MPPPPTSPTCRSPKASSAKPQAASAHSRSRSTAMRRRSPRRAAKLDFVMPRNGAKSTCDLIIDFSGRAPLFPDSARRDGYLRADPADPAAVARLLLKATDLVGEFEKPIYVDLRRRHLRPRAQSEKVGCRKCLDSLPDRRHLARRRSRQDRRGPVRRLRHVQRRCARPGPPPTRFPHARRSARPHPGAALDLSRRWRQAACRC